LLEIDVRTALVFVDRAQLSVGDYLSIFKLGLIRGDASSVALWMTATVPHLGWHKVFSVLREALNSNPRGGAFALYHVPYVCGHIAPEPSLSGSLPTRELTLECLQLIVLYHENGYSAVPDSDFNRIKNALWDHNFHMHDSSNSISIEFELSWTDWLDSRHIRNEGKKTVKLHKDDYLRFSAEHRQFSANELGWMYTNSSGTARHEWRDLTGVAYLKGVIILMSPSQYPLPRAAFTETQLTQLLDWLKVAMDDD
jgi:hypothetical protein